MQRVVQQALFSPPVRFTASRAADKRPTHVPFEIGSLYGFCRLAASLGRLPRDGQYLGQRGTALASSFVMVAAICGVAGLSARRPVPRWRRRKRGPSAFVQVARKLEIVQDDFVLCGQKHRILSGSVSYWRMLPEQWGDRLEKLKGLGCNAAEVYVPWNMHQPTPGEFHFEGRLNLPAFLELCRDMELDVLLRPGPYICAEWDFGGLPWWLMDRPDPVPLRSSDARYLCSVDEWWLKGLFPRVRPHLGSNGGPVIALQLENEFGYWGKDEEYLQHLRDLVLDGLGPDGPLLFTSDGTFLPYNQENGGLEGVLRTANFGSDPSRRLAELREAQPSGPLCNMEFWVGWFDAWGAVAGKSYRAPGDVARTLRQTLEAGASVNFFVFHGGTSFGLCGAGANLESNRYAPQVTSYDYGGLLDEAGEVTEKYLRCREVLADFLGRQELNDVHFPRSPRLPASPPLELEASLHLEAALPVVGDSAVRATLPLSAERLQCGYGYVLYRTSAPRRERSPLRLGDNAVRDYASVMVDGRVLGTLYRNDAGPGAREFRLPEDGERLDILVDIMNRVNFGPGMRAERKGLVGLGSVQLGSALLESPRAVTDWDCIPLRMTEAQLANLPWAAGQRLASLNGAWDRGPRFFRYGFYVREPADGFLLLEGFRKGFACANGFNIGRYWDVGPQRSLYMPGPLLRRGRNEIIVFDIDSPGGQTPCLRVVPDAVWTSGVLPRGVREVVTDAAADAVGAIGDAQRALQRAAGTGVRES